MSGEADELGRTGLVYVTGNPAEWPIPQDAVAAAGAHHRVLLENDRVRVLEVVVGPGEQEPPHHHRWPSVIYMTDGDVFIDRDIDGNVLVDTREFDAPLALPLTMWKEPEALHSVQNLSADRPIRLIRVELKE